MSVTVNVKAEEMDEYTFYVTVTIWNCWKFDKNPDINNFILASFLGLREDTLIVQTGVRDTWCSSTVHR